MSLNMKLITEKCGCCGNSQLFEISDYKMSESQTLELQEYYDYIHINFNRCNYCGYVSTNIFNKVNDEIKKFVFSDKYQNVLNDVDMKKLLEFVEFENFNLGELNALELITKNFNKNDFEYAKIESKLYEVKNAVLYKIFEDMADETDEQYEKKYSEVVKILREQLNDANLNCLKIISNFEIKNPYQLIFKAQCLTRNNDYILAKTIIQNLKENFNFENNLKKYIDIFLTKVEVIDNFDNIK